MTGQPPIASILRENFSDLIDSITVFSFRKEDHANIPVNNFQASPPETQDLTRGSLRVNAGKTGFCGDSEGKFPALLERA
jgi:hypothetical protein